MPSSSIAPAVLNRRSNTKSNMRFLYVFMVHIVTYSQPSRNYSVSYGIYVRLVEEIIEDRIFEDSPIKILVSLFAPVGVGMVVNANLHAIALV